MSAAEMREALKPCPFCGGEATYCADHTTERVDSISCRRCDFYMSDPELEQGSVIAAWNRRAPLPDEEGMVEKVLGDWGFVEALIEHAIHADVDDDLKLRRAVARAALRAINGGEP